MKQGRILVVDDEENIRAALQGILTDEGYDVLTANDGESALRMIQSEAPDLVLLDIWVPGIDGIQTLKILKNIDPDTEVVMMSGHGAIETAVKTTKIGAFDFIEKPFSMDALLTTVAKAIKSRNSRRRQFRELHSATAVMARRRFLGSSSAALGMRQWILEASEQDEPILIVGETGLGKKFAARMIHAMSERRDRLFIEVPCASLTPKSFERTLLGGKGKTSRFELADGGSLLFDGVDRLKPELRQRLATILQDGSFLSPDTGGKIEFDVRVMACSRPKGIRNGPLADYFGSSILRMTPLRDRRDDITEYVDYFVEELADEYSKHIESIAPDALAALHEAPWLGNLIELKSFLADAITATAGPTLEINDFPGDPADSTRTTQKGRTTSASFTDNKKSGSKRKQKGMIRQRTLKTSVVLCGQGLHSGIKTGLILSPLPPDSGVIFGDISTGARIPANLDYVQSTDYATTLSDGLVTIKTIEHIMSALHSYQITNILIKIGDEAPIMDGSALDFCELIEDSGIEVQEGYIEEIIIDKTYEVGNPEEGAYLKVEPSDSFSIDYYLEYPDPIGTQEFSYRYDSAANYKKNIAPARTFGFLKDIKELNEMGLAAGGKLTNVVLIDDEKIVNTPLRFPDEPARHKILDLIGDLYLLGRPIRGRFTARRSGHTQNIALIHEIVRQKKKTKRGAGQRQKRYAASG